MKIRITFFVLGLAIVGGTFWHTYSRRARLEAELVPTEWEKVETPTTGIPVAKSSNKKTSIPTVIEQKRESRLTVALAAITATDPKVLAEQLKAGFEYDAGSPRTQAVAEKLAAADPNSYSAAKAQVISQFLHLTDPKHGAMTPEEQEKVQASLAHADEVSHSDRQEDPQLTDLRLGFAVLESVKAKQSWQDIADQVEQTGRAYPNSPAVPYFQAYAQCRMGNGPECEGLLKQSLAKTKNAWEYQARLQTLTEVQRGNVRQAPFTIQMNNQLSSNN